MKRRSTRSDASASRDGSLAEDVYARLRSRILAGKLLPGDRLREVELADSLGVSRTPVREALNRLQSEGLLSFQSPRSMVVTKLTPQQAVELYAVREVLEGAAARFAAQHATDAEIRLLHDLLHQQQAAGKDPAVLARLNRGFHQAIYGMAHNAYLMEVLQRNQDHLVLLVKTTYLAPDRAEKAYDQHSEIVNAIEHRDPEAAEIVARRHIRDAQRIRMMLEFGLQ